MSSPIQATARADRQPAPGPAAAGHPGSTSAAAAAATIPTPGAVANRNRRRPLLVALAVLLLLVSALAGSFAFSQVSTTVPVVAVARDVAAGQMLQRADLTVVQINQGSGLTTVPADQLTEIVGQRATVDLTAGTTLTPDSFAGSLVPTAGRAMIGVLATPGTAPVSGLVPGADVLLVTLPPTGGTGSGADPTDDADPAAPGGSDGAVAGKVVAVTTMADGTGLRVDVTVAVAEAARLQRLSAGGRLAIVVVSKER